MIIVDESTHARAGPDENQNEAAPLKPIPQQSFRNKSWLIGMLGFTQLVGWGALYYSFGVLMASMQSELGLSKNIVVGAYSVALAVAGALSIVAGKIIDRIGGRLLMSCGSLLGALMLALMAYVQGAAGLYAIAIGIGVAMSATLYQPAFAVLTQQFGSDYRRAITMLTLIAGFSSTVFWPLTQLLLSSLGWRHAWLALALMILLLCFPLHCLLPTIARKAPPARVPGARSPVGMVVRDPVFQLVTGAITLNSLVTSALFLHLLTLLQSRGIPAGQAALIGACLGPMQVLGRILEILFGRRLSSRGIGALALCVAPVALGMLIVPGTALLPYLVFAGLYGLANGVMTIVRGTLPAELWGQHAYGAISGAMATPTMIAHAAGPFAASLLYTFSGGYGGVAPALAAVSILAAMLFLLALRRLNTAR
jgi:hypothetical protein